MKKLFPLLFVALAGCSNLQGVNVGASIPIGGVIDVGVNTTVGDGTPSAPRGPSRAPDPEADDDEADTPSS